MTKVLIIEDEVNIRNLLIELLTGTPMARLQTPTSTISIALKMQSEGIAVRASGRVLDKSHSAILRWQQRVAQQESAWTPTAEGDDVILENDELYTHVGENLPPNESVRVALLKALGWTMTCIGRNSRYWLSAMVGRRDERLFEQGVQASWQWAETCTFVRW